MEKINKLLIATKNEGKLREIKALLKDLSIEVLSLKDMPDFALPEEGNDYFKNACHKAEAVSSAFNLPAIADDSGLEVDFLDGCPGPLSARFGGEEISDTDRNKLLLRQLQGIPQAKRTAKFRCMIALSIPGKKTMTIEATCEGVIAQEIRGDNGFGYDPVFYIPELDKTFAEIDKDVKNRISHRGKALREMKELLKKIFDFKD
ncbi:MAG: XTP/dITP diphosphatase [Candidatus Schekmanbacteria bacterium]|nr:XTP/dITP diphosphatase [Candidatus Schekmanbacteria bacterium]